MRPIETLRCGTNRQRCEASSDDTLHAESTALRPDGAEDKTFKHSLTGFTALDTKHTAANTSVVRTMAGPPRSDPTPLEDHLRTALEAAENDTTKYHLRAACQKYVVRNETSEQFD